MKVFADAFYFIALLNRRDAGHRKASAFGAGYAGTIFTTEWVLVEFADAAAGTPMRSQAAAMIAAIRTEPEFQVLPASDFLLDRALELYTARADKKWSLTDCISFLTMQDEQLTDALTADHHFVQAGFNALLCE